jgi:predicted PurR-regulated permease PerM
MALVTAGPLIAIWVIAGYLLVNILVGNIIEPKFLGDRLGLSTLVVFLSLVFWGWILGTTGMFLSVPLTMVIKLGLEASCVAGLGKTAS